MSGGWRELTLAELCSVVTDGSHFSPPSAEAGLPYVTVRDVVAGVIDLEGAARIAEEDFSQLEASGCRPLPGDVLFSKDGTVGRVAVVRTGQPFVVLSSLAILRPRLDLIDSSYLGLALTAPQVISQVLGSMTGTALRRVTLTNLKPTRIPVPPLDEQRRIVAILEDHLSRLDAAAASLESAQGKAAALVRAALRKGLAGDLVPDDVSEGSGYDLTPSAPAFEPRDGEHIWPTPATWRWVRVGDAFEVNIGATPSRADFSLWGGDIPWVSSGEVAWGRISETAESITRSAVGNAATRLHPPGTVMLAMIGEGKTRGQAAILDVEAAHNQNCASIRVSKTKVLPEYVFGFLEDRYLESRRGASGGQQPALNKARIQSFPIPIPPLAVQRRLVDAWDAARDGRDRLRAQLERAEQEGTALRRSILAAAFRGDLAA